MPWRILLNSRSKRCGTRDPRLVALVAVTLVATLFAFGAKEADRAFVVIAWVPVLVFAGLDAYFLWRERLFRLLYAKVATKADDAPADFSMDTSEFRQTETWRRNRRSRHRK